jgi:hypothetical protein
MNAMKTRAWSIVIVLVAVGFAGATQGSPYEQLLKQVLQSVDKVTVTLETIKDEESAAAAKPDLRKAATLFLEAKAKGDKMQPPEKDEKVRLEKMYKPKLKESMEKMNAQVTRVQFIPGGKDALKEISVLLPKSK